MLPTYSRFKPTQNNPTDFIRFHCKRSFILAKLGVIRTQPIYCDKAYCGRLRVSCAWGKRYYSLRRCKAIITWDTAAVIILLQTLRRSFEIWEVAFRRLSFIADDTYSLHGGKCGVTTANQMMHGGKCGGPGEISMIV